LDFILDCVYIQLKNMYVLAIDAGTACSGNSIVIGHITGTNFVLEEVRLEWMPLSTSISSYEPPVARFHVQHYRDLPISTTWVTADTEQLFSVVYKKKLASSWIKVFWSLSLLMKGNGVEFSHLELSTQFNGNHCNNPAQIAVSSYMDELEFIIGEPVALIGVCGGFPAGDITISLVKAGTTSSIIQPSWNQRPHLIIEEVHNAFVTIS